MSEVSVPSTLVKCLYLFFDLPELSEKEGNSKDTKSDFTSKERRILLQKIFVQVLYFLILIVNDSTLLAKILLRVEDAYFG